MLKIIKAILISFGTLALSPLSIQAQEINSKTSVIDIAKANELLLNYGIHDKEIKKVMGYYAIEGDEAIYYSYDPQNVLAALSVKSTQTEQLLYSSNEDIFFYLKADNRLATYIQKELDSDKPTLTIFAQNPEMLLKNSLDKVNAMLPLSKRYYCSLINAPAVLVVSANYYIDNKVTRFHFKGFENIKNGKASHAANTTSLDPKILTEATATINNQIDKIEVKGIAGNNPYHYVFEYDNQNAIGTYGMGPNQKKFKVSCLVDIKQVGQTEYINEDDRRFYLKQKE